MASSSAAVDGKFTFMKGTEGKLDYLLYARRGTIGLGIKPNVIMKGKVAGTTYIGVRLRSSGVPKELFAEEKVTSLVTAALKVHTAWPGVTWEKADDVRASTQIGVFVKGTPEDNPQMLLAELDEGKLAAKMADYLIGLAGTDNLTISRDDLIEWIDKFYRPVAENIRKQMQASKVVDDEITSNLGVFGMQAALMKKVHDSLDADEAEDVPDFDENEDPDEGGEEE